MERFIKGFNFIMHKMYKSLFDRVIEKGFPFNRVCDYYHYCGSLEKVLEGVESIISSPKSSSEHMVRLALHAPRIIRAVIDYKIENPDAPEIEGILKEAVKVALGIYYNSDKIREDICDLREYVADTGNAGLMSMEFIQITDSVTAVATHPALSQNTAGNLASTCQSRDVLLIALGHGGVAAGMDVYLRYCEIAGNRNSVFYVARFSTHKSGDEEPRLSDSEIEWLQQMAEGREVVVFDEDKGSGRTLKIAYEFFSEKVFPGKCVTAVTNYNPEDKNF